MANNNIITIAAIEQLQEAVIGLENLEPHAECCIYKVPKDIRKENEEAYTPQVISIGPLHHGIPGLREMEKQKIRYKRIFRQQINEERWQELITYIETNEQRIRNCYEEMPRFEKLNFITMILYDAIFIIEFFLRCHYGIEHDFLLSRQHTRISIFMDLQLLENQLPYFILNGLYMLAIRERNRYGNRFPSFFSLSCEFLFNRNISRTLAEVEIKHFVDLRRYILTKTYPTPQFMRLIMDFPSAVKLRESGVRFKGIKGKGLLEINFEKKKRCNCIPISCLGIHELQIPVIEVYDEMEGLIRNVMALEQCQYPYNTHVCNYIDFMDNLINTEEDVNLLIDEGIISNQVGDTTRIKNMFNNLCLRISISPSCYYDIVKDLKAHYKNPWNHIKATLKSVYFSNLWRGTATSAAIALLLLTLIQSIFSILQVV